jgi:hypothetical protein
MAAEIRSLFSAKCSENTRWLNWFFLWHGFKIGGRANGLWTGEFNAAGKY